MGTTNIFLPALLPIIQFFHLELQVHLNRFLPPTHPLFMKPIPVESIGASGPQQCDYCTWLWSIQTHFQVDRTSPFTLKSIDRAHLSGLVFPSTCSSINVILLLWPFKLNGYRRPQIDLYFNLLCGHATINYKSCDKD